MRIYFDSEFDNTKDPYVLISIGMITEAGDEFYAVSNAFNPDTCSTWVKDNVLNQLPHKSTWQSPEIIRKEILNFVARTCQENGVTAPQFWAYYASWDFMLLMQLMGGWNNWPTNWPFYVNDLRSYMDWTKVHSLPQQIGSQHDALEDARWNKQAHEYIEATRKGGPR